MIIDQGRLTLGGVPASDIAARFGTPVYAIEREAIRARYERMVSAIVYRPLAVHYACKANPSVAILRYLRGLGAGLDACSPGDLAFGDAAGFTADEVIYTGCVMSEAELRFVAQRGLLLNIDSLSQLERFGVLAPGAKVGLRINCGITAGFHPHVQSTTIASKFGIYPVQIAEALAVAARHGLRVVGLHTHLGSDIFDIGPAVRALEILIELSEQLPELEYVDVGGGWGVPFMPDDPEFDMETYGTRVSRLMSDLSNQRSRPIVLRAEPGAYLLSDAGWLLMRVTDLKMPVQLDDGSTPWFAGTNSSYNHVFSAAMYDSFHQVFVADRADSPVASRYHLVGNLMQAGDVLAKDRPLPELRVGDVLAMKNCGSYSACRAPVFNSRPRPGEVLVWDGQAQLIRRHETVADLLAEQIDLDEATRAGSATAVLA